MLPSRIWKPLLRLRGLAVLTGDEALILYYAPTEFGLQTLERDLEQLERATLALRAALEAARSRGEDPLTGTRPEALVG